MTNSYIDNKISNQEMAVFLDFDGTVTKEDVVDGILKKYSINKEWLRVENEWQEGRIGSDLCLQRQLADVRITQEELNHYLASIELDPHFKELVRYLTVRQIPSFIISDGFDLFIDSILKLNEIDEISFRANHLLWENNQLIPSFPHKDYACQQCGHCKKKTLKEFQQLITGKIIFAGDGLSDRCAVSEADLVFAKGKLREYCIAENVDSIPYNNFLDVKEAMEYVLEERFVGING